MGSPLLPSQNSQILLWKFLPQFYAEVTTSGATVIKNNAWSCLSTSCQGPGPFLESGGPAQESTDLQKVLATPHREGQLAKNGMDPFCKLDGMVFSEQKF